MTKNVETMPEKHLVDSLQKKNSCIRDIAHNKQSVTIRNSKPGWWGAPLAQEEKYQGKGNL
jgi:hypothetical protein